MMRVAHVRTGLFAAAFILVWALLLPGRLAIEPEATFVDDASQYNMAAVHLVREGMYSLDGITPFFAREPGQSVFLSVVYRLAGEQNRVAIFIAQGLLVLLSSIFLSLELRRRENMYADIFLVLMLLCAPVYHVIFSPIREALALSLCLCFTAFVMRLLRTRSWKDAAAAGLMLGGLMLSYATFLLLPVLFIPLLLLLRVSWKHILLLCVFAVGVLFPWGLRNYLHTGSPCLTGCNRASLQWYVRGVQAKELKGFEPLRCYVSEYITRDWTGRSPYCSFNGVMHSRWPDGFKATPEDLKVGKEGRGMILRHFPNYLWLSLLDVIELHLPYVNGWGFGYNLLATISMVIIYIGMLLSIPFWKERTLWPLLTLMAYNTGVFALTDGTPRYLLPVIFCYMALSGVGYGRQISRILLWRA